MGTGRTDARLNTNQIALVTANFGGIDRLVALPPHEGVDAFYYTDEETLRAADPAARESWTRVIVPNYPRYDFGPRLRSRYFKQQIHRLDEVRGHRWLVWADSAFRLQETGFLLEHAKQLASLEPHQRHLVVPHPQRATVREEYEFLQQKIAEGFEYVVERWANEKMTEQMEHFHRRGWDTGARLWCGGFWMLENSELFHRCLDDWWDQNIRFGTMDQLSGPIVFANRGCEPQFLDVGIWDNRYFKHLGHVGR